jgi:hypothetical protein
MKALQKIIIILFFLISITDALAQDISSGRMSISIQNKGTGIAITSIKDNAEELLNTSVSPDIFTLNITNKVLETEEVITSDTGWNNVEITEDGSQALIVLSNPSNPNLPTDLQANLSIVTNDNQSTWDLVVTHLGTDCTLMEATFPEMNIKAPGDDHFIYPLYSGRITDNPGSGIDYYNDEADTTDDIVGVYPRGWGTTMQFFSYYNDDYGLYFGFHDPDASLKEFGVKDKDGGIKILSKTPIPNKTIAGNDWDFAGKFELDLYDGDWYDAAQIYKNWVSTEASYWPEETPERYARQHHVGDIGVWLTTSDFNTVSMEDMENYIETAVDFFDVPVGMHIYKWNYFEMDHFYPVYFPERTGLGDLVSSVQTNTNVTIMPYINGRMWDTGEGGGDPGDADAAIYFDSEGFADATKHSDGSVINDYPFEGNIWAIMCPTQSNWQDIITDASDQLTRSDRIQANSVYLDMVCASAPAQCMDPSHGHTLGGGSWWRAGYKQMFQKIHNELPIDDFLTVEGGNDFLLDEVDAFMIQGWETDNQVPAWQAVYTGQVQLFGTLTGGSHYPLQKFYGRLGQGFAYGVQTGRQFMWLAVSQNDDDTLMAANWVKRLSRMRYKLKNFMSYGEMKRPIEPISIPEGTEIPTITYEVYDWGGHHGVVSVTTPAIQHTVWQNDNEVVYLFVNDRIQSPAGTTGGAIPFKFEFNGADYGFTGNIDVQRITPTSEESVGTEANSFEKTVILHNLEVVAYKMTGSSSESINDQRTEKVSIFPNPTASSFHIMATFTINRVKIYNTIGQLVFDKEIKDNQVPVSNLTKGMYLLSFEHQGNNYVEKLLIH